MNDQIKNFDSRFKLYLASCYDDFKPFYNLIHFRDGYAYATEGHILVKAKIKDISTFEDDEIEKLDNKSISANAYRKILEYNIASINNTGVTVTDTQGNRNDYYFNEQQAINIKFDDMFAQLTEHYRQDRNLFGLNPGLVAKAAKILNAKTLRFQAYNGGKFIITNPQLDHETDIRCLLMDAYVEEYD